MALLDAEIDSAIDVAIIGTGLSGLSAAVKLNRHGIRAHLFDKARAVGGRLATRRIDGHVFDHGAQFFTVRSKDFTNQVSRWVDLDIVRPWYRGLHGAETPNDRHPRFACGRGMTSIAKELATQLNSDQLHLEHKITSIRRIQNTWALEIVNRDSIIETILAKNILVTVPVPQAAQLFADVHLAASCDRIGQQIDFAPCLALMVIVDAQTAAETFPPPGGKKFVSDILSWGADNHHKGISPLPGAITLHATPEFSRRKFDCRPETVAQEMLKAAGINPAAAKANWQLKKWRYATPTHPKSTGFHCLDSTETVILAGDAFAGAKVEGAWMSGLLAASHLIERVQISSEIQERR